MTCFSKMWLVQNLQRIKVLALTSFIYLISPVLLLCILFLLIYRGLICALAKVKQKDLYAMISPSTSLYASDEMHGIPNRNTVCFLVLKGRLSIDMLQNCIDKKILSANTKGSYQYPHLRMYPTKFHKFLFWKLEDEFKVENHVMMYEKARDNNQIWTEMDIREIQRNLIRKQWARFASPWEILLIPNYRTQNCGPREVKTMLCVRFHTCIGTVASSWIKLLLQIFCDDNSKSSCLDEYSSCGTDTHALSLTPTTASCFLPATFIATSHPLSSSPCSLTVSLESSSLSINQSKERQTLTDIFGNYKPVLVETPFRITQKCGYICGKILQKLVIPFKTPFDLAEQIMEPCYSHDWQVAETNLLKRDHVVVLDRFSVQHVKEIKKTLGVRFSSVLMAALSSAIRITFLEAGLKVPNKMTVMLPLNFNANETAFESGTTYANEGSNTDATTHG